MIKIAFLILAVIGALTVWQAFAQSPEELRDQRTRDSKTLDNRDGSFTATFGQDLHIVDNSGALVEPDLTFTHNVRPAPGPGLYVLQQGDEFTANSAAVFISVRRGRVTILNKDTLVGIAWLLPSPARIEINPLNRKDAQKVSFIDGGQVWEFVNIARGVKLQATVAAPKGPQNYSFAFANEGLDRPFTVENNGTTLRGTGFRIRPITIIDGQGIRYAAGNYTVNAGTIQFSFDDSVIPLGNYPYVIDPTTTFDVDASANDVDTRKQQTGGYPPDGSASTDINATDTVIEVRKQLASTTRTNMTGLVAWDTSSLPDDAIVTSATLTLDIVTGTTADNRTLVISWYTGDTPFSIADHVDDEETLTAIAAELVINSSDFTAGSHTYNLNVDSHNIDVTGITALRFSISGGDPSGNNLVEFDSFDNGSGEPQLAITYTTPVAETSPAIGASAFGSIYAYEDLLEASDFLVVVPYDITVPAASGLPAEIATEEYQFNFKDSTTVYQTVFPQMLNENGNKGYREGVAGFYFTAEQVSELGLTFNSPGTYTVELDAINGTQNTTSTTIVYRSGAAGDLFTDMEGFAHELDSLWGIDLIDEKNLTALGQEYFNDVIPLLDKMVPDLMNLVIGDTQSPQIAHDTTQSDSEADFWSGTVVASGFTDGGTWLGMDSMQFRTMISLLMAAGIAIGLLVARVPAWAAILGSTIFILAMPTVGMVPLALGLIIAFFMFIGGVFAWILRDA